MRMADGGPFGSHAVASAREYCTRTGRPISFEINAASIAASSASFMPYEPGPGSHVTRTCSILKPAIPATALRSG